MSARKAIFLTAVELELVIEALDFRAAEDFEVEAAEYKEMTDLADQLRRERDNWD